MSWTIACFCGRVFHTPAACCPRCAEPVPSPTSDGLPPAAPLRTIRDVATLRRLSGGWSMIGNSN